MKKNPYDKRLNRCLYLVAIALFIGIFVGIGFVWESLSPGGNEDASQSQKVAPSPSPTPSPSQSPNSDSVIVVEKLASAINYLFVAASVLLGLVGRLMLEPLLGEQTRNVIRSNRVIIILRHAAVQCLISICYGFFTFMYLLQADLENAEWQIRVGFFCQMISMLFAALLLMLAVNSVVKDYLKPKEEFDHA